MLERRFEAVIPAGGSGRRLSPLTDDMPKPALPVCGIPAISRSFAQLAGCGIESAAVTVREHADVIENADRCGLYVECIKESTPLGSAGGIRNIVDRLADTVVVIPGDAVFEFDLRSVIEKHKTNGHAVTVVLTRSDTPAEYGTVIVRGGVVTGFMEKASWADTLTDLVNTGIYVFQRSVLEMIPQGVPFDFAADFFPMLRRKGVRIHGFETDGYWCDIGSPADYYAANMHFSGGKSIFGKDCSVAPGAAVKSSIIFDGVTVGNSRVENAIVCSGAEIGDGCIIPRGCVIGGGCIIEDGAALSEGLKLRPGTHVRAGTRYVNGYIFGHVGKRCFDGSSIFAQLSSQFCISLGKALSAVGVNVRVGVMYGDACGILADATVLGAAEAGCEVIRLGMGIYPLAAFAAHKYECDCVVFIETSSQLHLLGREGAALSTDLVRLIEKALEQPSNSVDSVSVRDICPVDDYISHLKETVGDMNGISMGISGGDALLIKAASTLGAETTEGGFTLTDGGRKAEYRGVTSLSKWQVFLLAATRFSSVYITRETPVSAEKYLRSLGVAVRYYNDSPSENRRNAFQSFFAFDGIAASLLAAKQLHEAGLTPSQAKERLPEVFSVTREITGDEAENAAKIRVLSAACNDLSRGVRINYRGGSVAVYPSARGGFKIFAEAVSNEIAEEICSMTEKQLK